MLKKAALVALTTGLVACGSGGGSSDSNGIVGSDRKSNNNPYPDMQITRHAMGPITDINAEQVATEVAIGLDFLIFEFTGFLYFESGTIYNDYSYPAEGTLTEECESGGYATHTIDSPSRAFVNGYRLTMPGEMFSVEYDRCGDEEASETWYWDGGIRFDVTQGAFDGFDPVLDPTSLSVTFTDFAFYNSLGSGVIQDGILNKTIEADSESFESDYFGYVSSFGPYEDAGVFTNLDGVVDRTASASSFYDAYQLTMSHTFGYEIPAVEMQVNVEVESPLVVDELEGSYITQGEVLVTGSAGTMRITFYDDFLSYDLDANRDGSFETGGIVEKQYYW